jgi:hypothetical protein
MIATRLAKRGAVAGDLLSADVVPHRDDATPLAMASYLIRAAGIELDEAVKLVRRPTLREECRAQDDYARLRCQQSVINAPAKAVTRAQGELVIPGPQPPGFKSPS